MDPLSLNKIHSYLCEILNDGKRIEIEIKGVNEQDKEFRNPVNKIDIHIGDEFYLDISKFGTLEPPKYKRIKVTYIRSGVIFYTTKKSKKEYYIPQDSLYFISGRIFPTIYEVDTKKFPKEYYKFTCRCPYTKIIYK